MNRDIFLLLKDWEYKPSGVAARWIMGDDNRPKVQLRLDLGLFQMEVQGRPDGQCPAGHASYLELHEERERLGEETNREYSLADTDCLELQQEAIQFYYRYLAFFSLRYFDGVIADTEHSMRIFDLVARCMTDDDAVWSFMQFFPYVRMMNARARSEKALEHKDIDGAIRAVEEGLAEIRDFWTDWGEPESGPASSPEEGILQTLLGQLRSHKPRSQEDQLAEALQLAIKNENYEKAAVVRDQLKELRDMKLTVAQPNPRGSGG